MAHSHNYVMNTTRIVHHFDTAQGAYRIRFFAPSSVEESLAAGQAFDTFTLWFKPDEWEALLTIPGYEYTLNPFVGGRAVPKRARLWSPAIIDSAKFIELPPKSQIAVAEEALRGMRFITPWTKGDAQKMVEDAWVKLGEARVGEMATPGPRKPVPQLPAESNTLYNVFKPFDPKCAWNATRIAAGDPPRE